jgi:hypothetical protein
MSTILSDREYDSTYTDISQAFPECLDRAIDIVNREVLQQLPSREEFLEIGPGPGIITRAIAPSFGRTSIVEPNTDFRKRNVGQSYVVFPETFQTVELPCRYDFILCSYVLYHVVPAEWPSFVEKMVQSLAPDGLGMIVMGAPRGYHYDFRTTINPDCVHSGMAIDALRELGVAFHVVPHTDSYHTLTLDHMSTLCRFSIVESCFTSEEFDRLTPEQNAAMDRALLEFSKDQKGDGPGYTMTYEADFIVVGRAPQGAAS